MYSSVRLIGSNRAMVGKIAHCTGDRAHARVMCGDDDAPLK